MLALRIDKVIANAAGLYSRIVGFRNHLHRHPELSEKEFETQKYILDVLTSSGIPCFKIADTGVIATITGSRPGKTVALRADIDALPISEDITHKVCSLNKGVMHACGHDAHTAIALGYALFFNSLKSELNGCVKIFFQPAEETVGGANRMINEGCLNNPDVDYCIGLHVSPEIPYNRIEFKYGTLNASADGFALSFKGKSAHGAKPDEGSDAILMAASAITDIQSIISRLISPLESCVITIGKISGGVKNNIIADHAYLEGTIRATSPRVRSIAIEKVKESALNAAAFFGGSAEYISLEGSYPPLINNNEMVDIAKNSVIELLGEDSVCIRDYHSMGGEDFSFFSNRLPSVFYYLGCRTGELFSGLHTKEFDIDQRCLLTGLNAHIAITLGLLGHI